jgi:hypothetical protein
VPYWSKRPGVAGRRIADANPVTCLYRADLASREQAACGRPWSLKRRHARCEVRRSSAAPADYKPSGSERTGLPFGEARQRVARGFRPMGLLGSAGHPPRLAPAVRRSAHFKKLVERPSRGWAGLSRGRRCSSVASICSTSATPTPPQAGNEISRRERWLECLGRTHAAGAPTYKALPTNLLIHSVLR